jgi:hypothetical protein
MSRRSFIQPRGKNFDNFDHSIGVCPSNPHPLDRRHERLDVFLPKEL